MAGERSLGFETSFKNAVESPVLDRCLANNSSFLFGLSEDRKTFSCLIPRAVRISFKFVSFEHEGLTRFLDPETKVTMTIEDHDNNISRPLHKTIMIDNKKSRICVTEEINPNLL